MEERYLTLQNRQGNTASFRLRQYRDGDEEGILACVRDEYADTYFKRDFYRPDFLKKEAQTGHITFLVAETEGGGIGGMLILKQFAPEETMCEIASQIFRRSCRGYGLAMPFFEYGMEILLSRSFSAAFCLPVLFHDVTQRLLYRLGLRATGLALNVFDITHIVHSYENGRNTKHSQGIQIRAVGKRETGLLYLPTEHQKFCRDIYKSLGVACRIAEEAETPAQKLQAEEAAEPSAQTAARRANLPAVSHMNCRQDALQSSLEIRIYQVGADLPERMGELHRKYPLRKSQTANVFLNICDENAVWAYRELAKRGYFFTGLKPLCSEKEFMVLHNSGEVEIFFEDYVLSEEFEELVLYVKECCQKGRRKRRCPAKQLLR